MLIPARAYFEAFMLGIREPSRAVAEVADLTDLEFHVRLKETAAPVDELRKICPWWRGEPARRNRFGADKTVVFVVAGGKAQMRSVRLGDAVGSRFEVLSGLDNGDLVVVRGRWAQANTARIYINLGLLDYQQSVFSEAVELRLLRYAELFRLPSA